jgi:hypothetical protein
MKKPVKNDSAISASNELKPNNTWPDTENGNKKWYLLNQ